MEKLRKEAKSPAKVRNDDDENEDSNDSKMKKQKTLKNKELVTTEESEPDSPIKRKEPRKEFYCQIQDLVV